MRKSVFFAVVAATSLGAFGAAWTNAGMGGWDSPSNWQGDVVPTSGYVTNDVGGTILVSDGVTAQANILRTGTVSGKSGHLQISGGSLSLLLPSIPSQIGAVAGGSGTIEMTGGELYVDQLQVGAYGTGSMVLSGGIVRSSDWSCIGRFVGGVGTLTITGSGVWESARLNVFASEQGTGTIVVENGGELRVASTNNYEFTIGNQATGVGILRINTGGTLRGVGVNAKYTTDTFILDGGTFVRDRTGDNTGFIRSTNGPGKFQVGPNGGTIDTSNGTQTVSIDIDDLPSSSSGSLVKRGAGTLVLAGAGSFTGGFTVEGGTLSVESAANLPGYASAPITIKSGATLVIGGSWTEEAFVALTNRAGFVVEEGGTIAAPAEFTDDYIVYVANGTQKMSSLNITPRLVKTGAGTLELEGYNALAGGVVVSNGTLTADYATSGLADTHLHLAGTGTVCYCYLGVKGDSFTTPIADSGAGTFSFGPFTGFKAADAGPFTFNIGGDGRTIKWPQNGDWVFFPNGGPFVVKNPLDANGKSNFTLKGNGTTLPPIIFEGGLTNSTGNGYYNFWSGNMVFPRRAGGARHESYRWYFRNGEILVTNATLHSANDCIIGDTGSNSGVSHVTFKDSVKTSGGGWDYVNGSTGTVLTVDGGSYTAKGQFNVGYSAKGKTGRLVLTNNASVTTAAFYMHSGSADLDSGSLTMSGFTAIGDKNISYDGRGPVTFTQRGGTVTMNASGAVGSNTGSVGRVIMTGGSMFMKDGYNFQVGARGNGTFIQTGGDVSLSSYACVGRYPGGVGEYRLHGGTLTHRIPASNSNYLFFLAEEGTGTVSIANGGRLTVTNASGICIASKATSKGTLILSPGGTYEATTAYGGAGDDTFVFNGGTFKMLSNAKASYFIQSTVNRRLVTPLGGAIDTAGKGDFTLGVPLTAASRPEELSETLIHRWRFDDGSLADCVGNSDATVSGTVNWTNGAVRLLGTANGTSCINLGTGILPTGGRGATIEMWFTQLERRQWARLICAGPSSTFWLSSNRGGSNKMGWLSINGTSGAYTHQDYELVNGMTYHMAVVFEKQLDDTWLITVSMRDAATGELIDSTTTTAPATWSFDKIDQAGGIWLGHSAAVADPDPYMDYHDVRIYNCAMTPGQLAASCAAGSEAHFYLMKKGAGMLTLSGANTYKAGTGVDGGTLTLASGAKLPATEMWAGAGATFLLNSTAQTVRELGGTGTVKGGTLSVTGTIQPGGRHAIGTLTVDGTALQSGTLVADVAADGSSDCLAATGTLDLTKLSFALGDANLNEDKVYTLATATEITGKFRDEVLPNRWRTFAQPTKVTLAYANGTVLMIR